VIVADVADSTIIVGADREAHLQHGVYAAQTTPLVSRTGHLVGMISTHWRHPYHPPEQDLASLDVLARQAADLIERSQTEDHTRFLAREVSHRAKNLLAGCPGHRAADGRRGEFEYVDDRVCRHGLRRWRPVRNSSCKAIGEASRSGHWSVLSCNI
jgi:GAF domain-containing protein